MRNATRRSFVLTAAGALALTGCSTMVQDDSADDQAPAAGEAGTDTAASDAREASRTLVAYFSRAGENYTAGGVQETEVGNTKVMAGYIVDALGCDEYEIVPAEEYPYSYDETLDVATQELEDDARPQIANALPSLADYDAILVGSPVWWGYPPQIIRTFLEGLASEAEGKSVYAFTTHGGSGLGNLDAVIAEEWPGCTIVDTIAMAGASINDDSSREEVTTWTEGLGI